MLFKSYSVFPSLDASPRLIIVEPRKGI